GTPSAATSPGTAKARSPIFFANVSARSRSRTFTATEAPRSCRRAAAARPRPRHAPVTTATRPAKSAFSIDRIVMEHWLHGWVRCRTRTRAAAEPAEAVAGSELLSAWGRYSSREGVAATRL